METGLDIFLKIAAVVIFTGASISLYWLGRHHAKLAILERLILLNRQFITVGRYITENLTGTQFVRARTIQLYTRLWDNTIEITDKEPAALIDVEEIKSTMEALKSTLWEETACST